MASTTPQTYQIPSSSPVLEARMDHPLDGQQSSGEMDNRTQHENEGISTPPLPMVHIRALVISGDSHVFSFEPETTVGRMKELIWSMWPSQWTAPAQPPSPSFMRILYAGRVLSDESTLSSNNLPATISPTSRTVIHISVRSFSMRAEEPEDPKKPSLLHPVRSRHPPADEDVGGCKCVIM